MPREPRDIEVTRGLILHGALKLYSEKGCRDVSMDDVARHNHMSKRTVYETFNDKTDLLEACCESIKQHIENSIKELHGKVDDPLMLTLYLVKMRAIHIIKYSKLFEDLANHYPELFRRHFSFLGGSKRDTARQAVEEVLDKAQQDGSVVSYVSTEEIAKILFSLGTVAMIIYPRDSKMQDVCTSMLSFIIIKGCLTEQALKKYNRLEARLSKEAPAHLPSGPPDEMQPIPSINQYLEAFHNATKSNGNDKHDQWQSEYLPMDKMAKWITKGCNAAIAANRRKEQKPGSSSDAADGQPKAKKRKTTKQKYDTHREKIAKRKVAKVIT